MKLSEAIRLGSMLKPQAFGSCLSADGKRTCAMGAAYDAIGRLSMGKFHGPKAWFLSRRRAVCPACGINSGLEACVLHLNDRHRWTREAIADWVATIEAAQAEAPAPVAAVPV